jgi:hypothetical protein
MYSLDGKRGSDIAFGYFMFVAPLINQSWFDFLVITHNYGSGRAGVIMSNIYLSTSLIYLACKEAGGVDPMTDECVNSDLTAHGMKPSALISNIALVSGLLSAFLMPVSIVVCSCL